MHRDLLELDRGRAVVSGEFVVDQLLCAGHRVTEEVKARYKDEQLAMLAALLPAMFIGGNVTADGLPLDAICAGDEAQS